MSAVSWQWAKANPDAAARRIRELERENAALRAWVKEEGEINNICTYGVLKKVCEDCGCEKRKEAQP